MESLFGGELGLLGGGEGGGLKEDGGCGRVGWRGSPSPEDMYSASHFALITAYQEIKSRLAGLERENSSIKRKLKIYEIKVHAEMVAMSVAGDTGTIAGTGNYTGRGNFRRNNDG